MSMVNNADVVIEINLKNNALIKAEMHISGNKILPMGENSDEPVFPAISELNSGDMLLQYIYKSYFPYSSNNWSKDEDVCFDQGFDQIIAINDFSKVKKIIIKERFEWDEGGSTTQQLLINDANCPFINNCPTISEIELENKKPTLPSSITFIGNNAFYGCDNLNVFVEENTPAHNCLEKNGMQHYVIKKNTPTYNHVGGVKPKRLHFKGKMANHPGCDYDVLRVITATDIFILYIQYSDDFHVENNPDVWYDPDDYMPEIINGKLMWGDIEIRTIAELAAALFFVLCDKNDFEKLKSFFELQSQNISYKNESGKTVLDSISNERKETTLRIDDLLLPFIEMISMVKNISEIKLIESAHGIIGENDLDDEELWDSKYKLDFSLLE